MLINLKDKVKSIGLMSGTSLDGIDVCLASHENNKHELISFRSYPYSESLKQKILKQSKNETSCVKCSKECLTFKHSFIFKYFSFNSFWAIFSFISSFSFWKFSKI